MAYKTGRKSVRKGKRGEREFARLFGGKRVPLSGALDGMPNDVVLPNGLRCEVKTHSTGLVRVYKALETHEVVLYKNQDCGGLYAMTADTFQLVMQGVLTRPLNGTIRPDKGLRQARAWIEAENADLLAFKADRKDWLVLIPEDIWQQVQDNPALAAVQG